MAFADYLDLRTAVLEEVGRPDIADRFDRLTKLAEARFNREVRHAEQVTTATVTVASGTGELPSDLVELIGVYDGNGYEYTQQPLQAVQPANSGFYAIRAGNLLASDADYTVQYYAAIPTITASLVGTNWLLAQFPEVYLYGALAEASKSLRDIEGAEAYAIARGAAITDLQRDDERRRYARARVRLQGNIE